MQAVKQIGNVSESFLDATTPPYAVQFVGSCRNGGKPSMRLVYVALPGPRLPYFPNVWCVHAFLGIHMSRYAFHP